MEDIETMDCNNLKCYHSEIVFMTIMLKLNYIWKISELQGRIPEFMSEGKGGQRPTDHALAVFRPHVFRPFTEGGGDGGNCLS